MYRLNFYALGIIGTVVTIYLFFYLEIHADWWFDDDPGLFALASKAGSLLDFFSKKEFIHIGSRNEIVPFLLVSISLDNFIGFGNPLPAYIHHSVSFFITVVLLYFVLLRFSGSMTYALAAALGWIFLPSTQVVAEFLTTRSYIEGLGFSLLAVVLISRDADSKMKFTIHTAAALFCLVCAMLYKEYFVSTSLALIFFIFLHRKIRSGMAACIIIAILYIAYRAWSIGINFTYGTRLVGFVDYLKSLKGISYIFSGSPLGYGIVIFLILLVLFAFIRKKISRESFYLFILLLMISLLTIYPTAGHIITQYRAYGTWYRNPFIVNTVIWVFGLYALWRITDKSMARAAVYFLLVLCIIPGSWKTKEKWNAHKTMYQQEGKFFLGNGRDKLLFSRVPADWFLLGVQDLYPGRDTSSYILESEIKNGQRPVVWPENRLFHDFKTIWRYNGNQIVEDKILFNGLKNFNVNYLPKNMLNNQLMLFNR